MTTKLLTSSSLPYLNFLETFLQKLEKRYENRLRETFNRIKVLGLSLGGVVALTGWLYTLLPKEISPSEDRGLIGVWLPPLPGKTINVFDSYVRRVEGLIAQLPEVQNYAVWERSEEHTSEL